MIMRRAPHCRSQIGSMRLVGDSPQPCASLARHSAGRHPDRRTPGSKTRSERDGLRNRLASSGQPAGDSRRFARPGPNGPTSRKDRKDARTGANARARWCACRTPSLSSAGPLLGGQARRFERSEGDRDDKICIIGGRWIDVLRLLHRPFGRDRPDRREAGPRSQCEGLRDRFPSRQPAVEEEDLRDPRRMGRNEAAGPRGDRPGAARRADRLLDRARLDQWPVPAC